MDVIDFSFCWSRYEKEDEPPRFARESMQVKADKLVTKYRKYLENPEYGWTILHDALDGDMTSMTDEVVVLKIIEASPKAVFIKAPKPSTSLPQPELPIHYAVRGFRRHRHPVSVVKALVDVHPMSLQIPDRHGLVPLETICFQDECIYSDDHPAVPIFLYLIRNSPKACFLRETSLLHKLVKSQDNGPEMIRHFAEEIAKACPETLLQRKNGDTALLAAIKASHLEEGVMEAIVAVSNEDVLSTADMDGYLPLYLAVRMGEESTILLLVEKCRSVLKSRDSHDHVVFFPKALIPQAISGVPAEQLVRLLIATDDFIHTMMMDMADSDPPPQWVRPHRPPYRPTEAEVLRAITAAVTEQIPQA